MYSIPSVVGFTTNEARTLLDQAGIRYTCYYSSEIAGTDPSKPRILRQVGTTEHLRLLVGWEMLGESWSEE